jgi:hypothetical protein
MSTAQKRRGASSEEDLELRDELETSGWQRRFETDATRARELVDLYSDLGYEVTTCKIAAQEIGPECAGCAIVACQRYVALYTRRPGEARDDQRNGEHHDADRI